MIFDEKLTIANIDFLFEAFATVLPKINRALGGD